MGFLWDLIQHGQISEQASRSDSLEERVRRLEDELLETRRLLLNLMERLETNLKADLNRDGRIGG